MLAGNESKQERKEREGRKTEARGRSRLHGNMLVYRELLKGFALLKPHCGCYAPGPPLGDARYRASQMYLNPDFFFENLLRPECTMNTILGNIVIP